MTVIQAIANRTLSGAHSVAEARAAFEARLQALARANRLVTSSNPTDLAVGRIVRMELEPFVGRTRTEGTDILLTPKHAQDLALALHELATNASKYGAFSNESGTVEVSWTLSRETVMTKFKLRWRETGGPPVVPPTRHGLGTSLLKATFADVKFDYAVNGLVCEFDGVLSAEAADRPDIASAR